jgi:hypothetical protein
VSGDQVEDPDPEPAGLYAARPPAAAGRADQAGPHSAGLACPANCPCRLLAPAAREQSTASLEAVLAASAERDPNRLAWALARPRATRGLDPAELAAWLGLGEVELPRFALSRRLRSPEERAELVARFGLDPRRLDELLAQV